jgi:hypothetical protein
VDILTAQIERYDLSNDINELQEISTQGSEIIDYAGKFTKNEAGKIIFNFGPQKNKRVLEEAGFARWMLTKDFTFDTKQKARMILKGNSSSPSQS